MKTNNILLVAALGGVLLGGCSRDDGFRDAPNGDAVSFTAGIVAAARTTGGGDAWVVGDAVGIYMLASNGSLATPADVLADNVQYNVTDAPTGALSPANGTPIYYPLSGTVDFIAYYPHGTVTAGVYDIRVANQADPAAIDVLYAKTTGMSKSNPEVGLTFVHVLSKVTLDVKAGTGLAAADISDLAASAVVFGGMPTEASLDLQDGALMAGTDLTHTFAPLKDATPPSGFDASFTALLVPQVTGGAGRTVTFTVGGQPYTWTIPDTETFTAGNHYTYPVTVNKTEITVGDPEITDWTTHNNGTGTAEQVRIVSESNSYMVEPNGTPILIPVSRANKAADPQYNLGGDATGLGGVTAGNFTVELIWSDLPVGAAGVVKEMFPFKEYVCVVPGVAGNAVIAIRDKDEGTIKWSWHIWVTEPVGSGFDDMLKITWMDRNLGAKSNTPFVNGSFDNAQWIKTLGLYYQWGRKDAYPIAYDGKTQIFYTPAEPDGTQVHPAGKTLLKMYEMVQNPFSLSIDADSYSGSLSVLGDDNKSWNDNDGKKTIYDPCPEGWRVPLYITFQGDHVWGSSTNEDNNQWTFANGYITENKGAIYNGFSDQTTLNHFYPATGYRRSDGHQSDHSTIYCWASSPTSRFYSNCLSVSKTEVNSQRSATRYLGYAIRCLKEW